jgi:hypothetical protein
MSERKVTTEHAKRDRRTGKRDGVGDVGRIYENHGRRIERLEDEMKSLKDLLAVR